jgi:hypothetical protein
MIGIANVDAALPRHRRGDRISIPPAERIGMDTKTIANMETPRVIRMHTDDNVAIVAGEPDLHQDEAFSPADLAHLGSALIK